MAEKVKVRFRVFESAIKDHPTEKRSVEEVSKEKIGQFFQDFWNTYEVPEERRLPINTLLLYGQILLEDWQNLFSFILTHERRYEFSGELCGWTTPGTKKIVNVMQKKLE